MKKIVLLSPFPPSQNPRLLKEYESLKEVGYQIKVLYGVRDKWAAEFNVKNTDFILVGGKHGSLLYFFSRALGKLSKVFLKLDFNYHRLSIWLFLAGLKLKADLYIGHNLASLPIVVKLAKFHQAKCGFDAEDFHRQEVTDNKDSKEYQNAKYLEDKYLPQLEYMTAASPLIALEYKKRYAQINPVVINNVFSTASIQKTFNKEDNKSLQLFWFSQTIGKNRGLEDVLQALALLKNPHITLHLLGNANNEIKEYLQSYAQNTNIHFHDPIPPDDIFAFASQFDIGLALEPGFCLNNELAISNKIFTYLTSGLALVASETKAQKEFIVAYPAIGQSYPIGNIERLAEIINAYYHKNDTLEKAKIDATYLAKHILNWETESQKLISLINKII